MARTMKLQITLDDNGRTLTREIDAVQSDGGFWEVTTRTGPTGLVDRTLAAIADAANYGNALPDVLPNKPWLTLETVSGSGMIFCGVVRLEQEHEVVFDFMFTSDEEGKRMKLRPTKVVTRNPPGMVGATARMLLPALAELNVVVDPGFYHGEG